LITPNAAPAAAPTTVSGKVYFDTNTNGTLDAGEKPAAGVKITDGVSIVTSDADGWYTIQVKPDHMLRVPGTQTIALCWPSGTWPTSKHWFRIKDVAEKTNCNFGLRQDRQSLPFTYLHVTDSHDWRASRYENQHDLTETTLREAKFILHTGDMSLGGATPEALDAYGESLRKWQAMSPMPTFTTIGNHDTDSDFGPDHELSFAGGFAKHIGPLRWSFDYAGIHFVMVDVIGDHKEMVDATADWLEKDLSPLPEGTRIILGYHYPDPGSSRKFIDVLRRHKVELVHAGHNHAYGRWRGRWPVPMVTAFARSCGALNVMRVERSGVHVGFFCDGCSRGAHNYQHSRRCPANWRTHFFEGAIAPLVGAVHEVVDKPLDGAAKSISVGTDAVYVTAMIKPGPKGATGIRVLKADGGVFEIAYIDAHITVNGTRFPTVIPPADQHTLRLYVFVHKGVLTVWANDVFFFEEEVKFERAKTVTAFADGGPARLVSLKVQEIKPDPANRDAVYYCPCDHGRIMRNPE